MHQPNTGGNSVTNPTYHDVVGVHGLHSIQELELDLLVFTVVLEGEVLHPPAGVQQLHGDTCRVQGRPGYP